jgi:hypothetical protein
MQPFFRQYIVLLLLLSFFGCGQSNKQQYIYIGHAYDWKAPEGNRVDPRIAALDLNSYDQIWLGGDICSRTSADAKTLDYLDSLFHISAPTTLWALGNHDINKGNIELITQKTKRPATYAHYQDGICLLVLNTNLGHPQLPAMDSSELCQALQQQFELLQQITDTIQQSAYLVLLHHHALLSETLVDGRLDLLDKWHYVLPSLPFSCTPFGTFEELAYPLLTEVQRKGVQVILVGGDLGQRAKHFSYQTKEGIWFLGSGINNSMDPRHVPDYVTNQNPDSILLFNYDRKARKLDWWFLPLGE